MKQLKEGDKIPIFSLKNQFGETIDISKKFGKRSLVIYFYPKNDTPGCTAEACSFRDSYEEFTDNNVDVIGISSDSVESHSNFAMKHNLSFTLLSDTNDKVRQAFGVKGDLLGLIPGRVTFIINKEGIIVDVFSSQFQATKHISNALKILTNEEL